MSLEVPFELPFGVFEKYNSYPNFSFPDELCRKSPGDHAWVTVKLSKAPLCARQLFLITSSLFGFSLAPNVRNQKSTSQDAFEKASALAGRQASE